LVRLDNTYVGKTITFLQKYKDQSGLIFNVGTTGTIISVISSYKALVKVQGLKTPKEIYNHWIDGMHVKIEH
jgi:hypothetical protein